MKWPKPDPDHLIVSSKQMEGLEKEILSSGLPVEALMEKVGQRMSSWLLSNPYLLEKGVVVLVGPGHNGGDGLVVARELYLAGITVSIWCPFSSLKPLTQTLLLHSEWLGVEQLNNYPDPSGNEIWIEALFGLGQNRPLPKAIADLLATREQKQPGNLISLDVPAGICSDSGTPLNKEVAHASFTLTVGFVKQGLIQDIALDYVGEIVRIECGFSQVAIKKHTSNCLLRIYPEDLNSFPWPNFSKKSSKYDRGRVLVIAGSNKYKGAALLALKAALASGVGSIQACLPQGLADSLWQCCPEVVLHGILETSSEGSSLLKNSLEEINFDRFDSLLIGPGIGLSEEKWSELTFRLNDFEGLLVCDADALNRIAAMKDACQWLKRRNGPTWITPHIGEFQKLFPDIDCSEPIRAAIQAASLAEVTVLLKGAHSIISTPDGEAWQITETVSCVARAGLGDVLAGFVAGIGAVGVASKNEIDGSLLAASALMHSHAGRICREGSNADSITCELAQIVKRAQLGQCLENPI